MKYLHNVLKSTLFIITFGFCTTINIPDDYATIQEGIDAASDGDLVLVQAGTYVENINFNGKNIVVQGEDRETTIIDGGDSSSVVTFENGEGPTALLSGFTITNGRGTGYPDYTGGGITCINYSNPIFTDLTISGNIGSGQYQKGGGVYIANYSNPTFTNVTISNNSAGSAGGIALMYPQSSLTLTDAIISENHGGNGGGGLYLTGATTLTNVIIESNETGAYGHGGGIWLSTSSADLIFTDVTISNNTAGKNGGGISCMGSPTLENVLINNNLAHNDGGGIYSGSGSNPTLTNVTIANNDAGTGTDVEDNGGGIFCENGSSPNLLNTILWNNFPQEIYFSNENEPNAITIAYSDISGSLDGIITNANGTVTWGDGNIDVDPRFLDAENDDYDLLATSQLINAGHPDSTDSDGSRADMGAYPYLNSYSGPTWYIAESGNDTTATGASGDPFRSIQAGINFSSDADSVTVAAGTYVENINFNGKNIALIGEDKETTIIDGDQSGSVVTIIYPNGTDGNTNNGVYISEFTITGGSGYQRSSLPIYTGGGFYLNRASPTITNVIITENHIQSNLGGGGALFGEWGSSPTLENVLIISNSAGNEGGAIKLYQGSDPILMNVTISGNVSDIASVIYARSGCEPTIVNSILWDNSSYPFHFHANDENDGPFHIFVDYSIVQGGENGALEADCENCVTLHWGEGNIDADPLFCEPDSGNYHIAGNSPSAGMGLDGADMGALGVGCGDLWLPPVIAAIQDTSMDEDSELSLQLSAESEQDYDIYFEAESDTSSIYVYVEDDMLHINLESNWNGSAEITVLAYSEFDYESNDATSFTLTVNPVNDEPMFHNLHRLVAVGMEFHVPIHVSDVDMDSLVVSFDESWDYPDWLSLAANPYALTGTAPEPVSIHFPLHVSDGQTTVTDTFHLSAQFFNPRITSVTDVPEDQGGRVYISFLKSFFDNPNESNQMYTVFRHDMVDNAPDWVVVGSGAAIGEGSYTYEVSTLLDSTSEGHGMTEFKVVASMDDGHFHSLPESGYSVDNIAPGVPQGLMAVLVDEGIQLTWEMSADEDFQYYMLEKSSDEAFTEPDVFEMIDIVYLDLDYVLNESNYYRIAAIDHAGNISDYSDVVDFTVLATDLDLIPEVFALHQNYPNPFNPTTQIRYDLPEDAMVSITIYDIVGRSIKSLVNSQQTAGYRSIQWNATNNLGEPVSAGMYIYMIQAGEFRQTKKMVLLK